MPYISDQFLDSTVTPSVVVVCIDIFTTSSPLARELWPAGSGQSDTFVVVNLSIVGCGKDQGQVTS